MITHKPTAIITGGSRGIGLELIKTFHTAGYDIVTTCTSHEGEIAIKKHVPDAKIIVWNAINDPATMITEACDDMKIIPNTLICNAGITRDTLAIRMKEQQWSETYRVNTMAPCMLSAWALRKMYAQRQGCILFISSVVAHTGNIGQANYIASKAAVEGLTRALAIEGGPRNIRVNCIAPGLIETDMTHALPPSHIAETLKRIPLSRAGSSEEIAKCALFLARDATYVTGQILHVNGGLFFN